MNDRPETLEVSTADEKISKYSMVLEAISDLGAKAKPKEVADWLMRNHHVVIEKSMLASYSCKARKELGVPMRAKKKKAAPAAERNGSHDPTERTASGNPKRRGRKPKGANTAPMPFNAIPRIGKLVVDRMAEIERGRQATLDAGQASLNECALASKVGTVLDGLSTVRDLVAEFGKDGLGQLIDAV